MADKTVKFNAVVTLFPAKYVMHYVPVDLRTTEKFPFHGRTRRVLCSIDGTGAFPCALMPIKGGDFCISLSKDRMKQLGLKAGQNVVVHLTADTSKYGMPMPAEFQEILDQDIDGNRLFHAITIGKQRSILYMLGKIADVDRRIHIGLIIIEHLKNNSGKIDDSTLYQEIKRPLGW